MSEKRTDAVAIARLYGRNKMQVIGWVYLWNNGELSIRWIGRKRSVYFIDPPIDQSRIRGLPQAALRQED